MTIGKHLFGKWTIRKWAIRKLHLENEKYSTYSKIAFKNIYDD